MKGTETPGGEKVAELTKRLNDKEQRYTERALHLSRRPQKKSLVDTGSQSITSS